MLVASQNALVLDPVKRNVSVRGAPMPYRVTIRRFSE
jgi:hypothetical protein